LFKPANGCTAAEDAVKFVDESFLSFCRVAELLSARDCVFAVVRASFFTPEAGESDLAAAVEELSEFVQACAKEITGLGAVSWRL
jgi:hypothetical protein